MQKLKPEEERVVTPGPKAVEDLVNLPTPEVQTTFGAWSPELGLTCRFRYLKTYHPAGHGMEEHRNLEVQRFGTEGSLGAVLTNTDYPWWLPSSMLTIQCIESASMQLNAAIAVLFENNMAKQMFHQNTIVDFDNNRVVHYPQQEHCGLAVNEGKKPLIMPLLTDSLPSNPRCEYTLAEMTAHETGRHLVSSLLGANSANLWEHLSHLYGDIRFHLPEKDYRTGVYGIALGGVHGDSKLHVLMNQQSSTEQYARLVRLP